MRTKAPISVDDIIARRKLSNAAKKRKRDEKSDDESESEGVGAVLVVSATHFCEKSMRYGSVSLAQALKY